MTGLEPPKVDPAFQQRVDAALAKELRAQGPVRRALHSIERILFRSGRVLAGAVLLLVAAKGCEHVVSVASTPLAAVSLGGILVALVVALLSLWGLIAAFTVAFGAVPREPGVDPAGIAERRKAIVARLLAADQASAAQTQAEVLDVQQAALRAAQARLAGNRLGVAVRDFVGRRGRP